jgi:hypothetical protein
MGNKREDDFGRFYAITQKLLKFILFCNKLFKIRILFDKNIHKNRKCIHNNNINNNYVLHS